MSATLAPALSARERWAALPEGTRAELIDTELFMAPAPPAFHTRVQNRFQSALIKYLERNEVLGEVLSPIVDVHLGDEIIVQPDALWISESRKGILRYDAIYGAPDLILEVISPSNAKHDLVVKRGLYEQFGVKEYWMIDPETKTVEVLTLTEAGLYQTHQRANTGSVESKLLPGLIIHLEALFQL